MKKTSIAVLVLIVMALASGCLPPPRAVYVASPTPGTVYVTTPAPNPVYFTRDPAPRRVVVRVAAPPPPRVRVHVTH